MVKTGLESPFISIGSGIVTPEVSVTPSTVTSKAMGGDMAMDVEVLGLGNLLMPEQVFLAQMQCSQFWCVREWQPLVAKVF